MLAERPSAKAGGAESGGCAMSTAQQRTLNRRLKALRAQWLMWRDARVDQLSHIDYCLLPCAEECGCCDGCVSAAYRAERRAEVAVEAARAKEESA